MEVPRRAPELITRIKDWLIYQADLLRKRLVVSLPAYDGAGLAVVWGDKATLPRVLDERGLPLLLSGILLSVHDATSRNAI